MNKPVKLPLTDIQQDVLQYIIDYFAKQNYPPTYIEIQKYFDFKSPGHAHGIVKALKKKRYLTTAEETNHRSLRLTELSEDMPTSDQLELFEQDENE